jgi:GST-like protein
MGYKGRRNRANISCSLGGFRRSESAESIDRTCSRSRSSGAGGHRAERTFLLPVKASQFSRPKFRVRFLTGKRRKARCAAKYDNAHNYNWTDHDRRSIHSANLLSDKRESNMTDTPAYTPPEVWVWEKDDSPKWRYSNTNRPVAGATHEKELARGRHPLQLYSLATPNGVKVTIMLEELLAAGHSGAEYDAWLIRIGEGNQFGSGFVGVNPNSKIPALMDYGEPTPRRVFESGAILLYLADKFGAFLPKDRGKRTEALNWLFWQMGSTPYLGGGFGHFYAYAPVKIKYAIDRFSMEVKRQLDVLDRQLADNQFIAGDEYTIADMAIWPWYGNGMLNGASYNDPRTFLQTHEYKNLTRWTKEIGERPAVKRGRMVNRTSGPPEEQLHERHDASDFETKTQDKIGARG